MAFLIILVVLFIFALTLRMPLTFALGSAVVSLCYFWWHGDSLNVIFQSYFSGLNSFTLIAIPFFILAGELMLQGGISKRLISCFTALIGNVHGALAIITVVSCMFFAAISGSAPATTAAIGAIMIPAMKKEGYNEGFAGALTATSGALGPIIPPSICFILFAVMAEQSITKLFIAGALPGILMAAVLCAFAIIVCKKEGFGQHSRRKYTAKEKLQAINDAKWSLLIPIIILGGIYSGIATPTEAAVVACIYGIIVGVFVYKELNKETLIKALSSCASTTGYCLVMMGPANSFAKVLTMERVPQTLADLIFSVSDNIVIVMLLVNVFLLICGMFIDPISGLIIMTPLLLPVVTAVGIDPIHFGVIIVVNITIGMCTPPVGANLFIAAGVAKMPMEKMFKYLIPCVGACILSLAIINIFPALSSGVVALFS